VTRSGAEKIRKKRVALLFVQNYKAKRRLFLDFVPAVSCIFAL
jgi:hypothetical protein